MKIFDCLKLKKENKRLKEMNKILSDKNVIDIDFDISNKFAIENIALKDKIKKLEAEKRNWMNRALRRRK